MSIQMNFSEFLDELLVFYEEVDIAARYANTILENISLPSKLKFEFDRYFIKLEAIRYYYLEILNANVLDDNLISKMKNASFRFKNDEYFLHQFLTFLDELLLCHGDGPNYDKKKHICKQPLEI